MTQPDELYQKVKLAAEVHIKAYSTANDLALLKSNPITYSMVLKEMKLSVQNQLSSHKSQMVALHSSYVNKAITLQQYTSQREEAFKWKIRALSFLQRIESELLLLKNTYDKNN